MKCKHCGQSLSKEEVAVMLEANEWGVPIKKLCDECFTMLENSEPAEDTFDSDSGL